MRFQIRSCIALLAMLVYCATMVAVPSPSQAAQIANHAPVSSGSLQFFSTESAAQAHCQKDQVVWPTNSGIYHEMGMIWYGHTKAGAYVCRAEADAAGDRDTRNGQ